LRQTSLTLRQWPGGIFDECVAGSQVKNVTKGVAVKITFSHGVSAYAREQNNAVTAVEVRGIAWAKGIVVGTAPANRDAGIAVAIANIAFEAVAFTATHFYPHLVVRAEIIADHLVIVAESEVDAIGISRAGIPGNNVAGRGEHQDAIQLMAGTGILCHQAVLNVVKLNTSALNGITRDRIMADFHTRDGSTGSVPDSNPASAGRLYDCDFEMVDLDVIGAYGNAAIQGHRALSREMNPGFC